MQIKLFTIPIGDSGAIQEDLNRFLRGTRVLEISHQFVEEGANSRWCFLIKYLENAGKEASASGRARERKDYKEILDTPAFARFVRLRAVRKQLAEEDGVPAFALFTDEQMAELARAESFSLDVMQKVSGIGAGRVDRYGERILALLREGKETP